MNYVQKLSRYIVGIVFPVKCLGCGAIQDGIRNFYICRKCIGLLPLNRSFCCIGCGNKSYKGQTCSNCSKTYKICRLFTVLDYKDSLVIKLIKTFKYRFVSDISFSLSFLAKKYLTHLAKNNKINIASDNPLFVPVPLDAVRENWRGFNQSALLAQQLANYLSLEYVDALSKTGSSMPQAEIDSRLDRLASRHNFRISLPNKVKDRHVVLVDDVVTTGSTLNECANILVESGALSVSAITIARGG